MKVNTHWGGVRRDQRIRHARVHGLRRDDRHEGVHQRQRRFGQSAGNGRLDGVHDVRHGVDARQRAPQERPRQALGRALLRHRQRDLGLRRQHDAGVLRQPVPPVRDLREGAARQAARDRRERRQRRGHAVGGSAHDERASRHGCDLASLLHHSHRRVAQEGQLDRLSGKRMDLHAQAHDADRRVHHRQREDPRRARSAETAPRSTSTSGAPGTTRSRAASRVSSGSRTRCATRWSRDSTSTSSTAMPSACR